MLSIFLMILGILLIVGGIMWLLNLAVDPLRKAFHIMFHRDWNYLAYEKGREGKEAVDEARRVLTWPGVIVIILGILLFLLGLYLRVNPGGSNLFGSFEQEFSATDTETEGYGKDALEYYRAMTDTTHMIISGDIVYYAGKDFATVDSFEGYVKTLYRMQDAIVISDDFAVAATFHDVLKILDAYGFSYELAGEW